MVPILDVVPTLCDAEHCDLEHDGDLVYRDAGHLASAYVVQEVPAVTDFLSAVTTPA